MKHISRLAAFAALLSLASCAGYQPGVSKPRQLVEITKLAVPTFTNETLAPRLEVLVTNALIKQLQIAGTYQIVPVDDAEAVVRGQIIDVTGQQHRAQRNNTLNTSELQVGLHVKYKVVGTDGKSLLNGQTHEKSVLVLDPNLQVTKQQALANAAERLARELSSELTEGW